MSIIGKTITRSCYTPEGCRYSPEHKQVMGDDPLGEFDYLKVVDTFVLAVVGPSTFSDQSKVRTVLDGIMLQHLNDEVTLLSGDTGELDDLITAYADENYISSKMYASTDYLNQFDYLNQIVPQVLIGNFQLGERISAKEVRLSKQKRDENMIRDCDRCLLFYDGKDPRVRKIIELCSKLNKPVQLVKAGE